MLGKNNLEYVKSVIDRDGGLSIIGIDNPTEEMCLEAVKSNGLALKFIDNPSEEVCIEAVKQSTLATVYIPEERLTERVCMEIIKNNSNGIKHIVAKRPEILTEEMCIELVKSAPTLICYLPERYRTDNVCIEAMVSDPHTIMYCDVMHEDNIRFDIIDAVVKRNCYLLVLLDPDIIKRYKLETKNVSDRFNIGYIIMTCVVDNTRVFNIRGYCNNLTKDEIIDKISNNAIPNGYERFKDRYLDFVNQY